jgi:omega-6 fatty acid desaturase (delta-12 desaturase)
MPPASDAGKNHEPTVVVKPELVREYKKPDRCRAAWDLLNTFIPYAALWFLAGFLVHQGYSYWILLLLAVPASAFLVRIFIFFHDCCHFSFFAWRPANRILGYIAGALTFTPFDDWRRSHGIHHATAQDLDRRGMGDIKTMTVEEYLTASKWKRRSYRLYRNPFVMFGLGPSVHFLILQRFPKRGARKRERISVVITDLAILTMIIGGSLTIGWVPYLLFQWLIMQIAGAIGIWLFYVQHQFEGIYWARHKDWDLARVALEGASYYKLPKVLQWFTGNIGLHHAHHLRPVVPNYNLQSFSESIPALQTVRPFGILQSFKFVHMKLWDEKNQKLVGFREINRRPREGHLQSWGEHLK